MNVPNAAAMKTALYATFRNMDSSRNRVLWLESRSLISIAAGNPVDKVMKLRMRNVHAMPTFCIRNSRAIARMVAPRLPPSLSSSFTVPRLVVKYFAGRLLEIEYRKEIPMPAMTPDLGPKVVLSANE